MFLSYSPQDVKFESISFYLKVEHSKNSMFTFIRMSQTPLKLTTLSVIKTVSCGDELNME